MAHTTEVELNRLIRLWQRGEITQCEWFERVWEHLWKRPEHKGAVLDALSKHADENVRGVVPMVQDLLHRCESRIKDIGHIRRTSPLQPGTRLILSGGYNAGISGPWWLNGRKSYKATFIRFAEQGAGRMPVALVELEEEIALTEGGGLRHKGRYALLKLMYVAAWAETETVTVHVVEVLPEDVEAFYSSHPFGTEIESHATYKRAKDICCP